MSALANVISYDLDERDLRWGRVRAAMGEQGIDLLIVLPESDATDARYLAQEAGAVLFPLEGDPWIVIGGEDSHLALTRKAWMDQRISATDQGVNRWSYGSAVAENLRKLKLTPSRVGIAGLDGSLYSHVRALDGYALYSTVTRILEALPGAEVVNAAPLMAGVRYIKSAAEISAVRAGVQVAEAAAAAIGAAYRAGTSQAELYRAGYAQLLEPGVGGPFGGMPMLAWCPGQWGQVRPRLVGTPTGLVEDGLCVATEIIAVVRGCFAQVAEPYVAGAVTAEQQEVFDLNIAAFEAACRAMRPGTTWREVKERTLAVAAGTEWKITFLLHGGVDGPLFIPGDRHEDWLDDKVEAGTTLICKPHAFPADQDDQIARSHDVTWGDMVVVREGGAERLGSRPQQLISYS
ncbi:Xaa-Pro aminopeptidase [Kribbella orskensis]|uniref:Xaa-Pro aminopeptidase n=1 Tax=Kribbella orskensis TaxID=2512216 RepID=A0ABY2BV29_9ACTN|nr:MULTISPECIES: M24 family metallopeptidase [Kribbella]TCN44191.1 Xaa-Pro aminopeptidase [Kribbella sp. VKM Ac-2500]TCO32031.1 Xaa-Pro aminopeptidase [Kribbella orskensis]